jgi:CheY-like chemotaxis protein
MDIKMPEMSGYELVGRLYSHKGFEEISVIFISGSDFDDKQLGNLVSKRVSNLKKPFSLTELLDKINSFSIPDFRGLTAEDGNVKS